MAMRGFDNKARQHLEYWEKEGGVEPIKARGERKYWYDRTGGGQKREPKVKVQGKKCRLCGHVATCGKCARCKQVWECNECHKCRYCDRNNAPAFRDWGKEGHNTGAEIEDREYRERWGVELRSAYLNMVGEAPILRAGDVAGARMMLNRIDHALDHGGWTKNENHRLHQMRDKWAARAAGRDARFMVMGTTRGGATKKQRDEISVMQAFLNIEKVLDGEAEGQW